MSVKEIYRKLLRVSVQLFGVVFTKKMDAVIRFHRRLNLKNPVSLADKLCYLELYTDDPLKARCTDKYAVREYVRNLGYENILIPLYGEYYTSVDDIKFEHLPNQFVVKAAHGCGMNLICADKNSLNLIGAKKKITKWLNEDYARACIEPHYKKIPRRVIIEKYLEDADRIIDYKIHCFHGEPDFILVCGNRSIRVQKRLYSLDWKPIDEMVGREKGTDEFKKPKQLNQMITISKKLSKDFDFVRVDLYEIQGKIYFGELTFSPASGVLPNFSEKFLLQKGKLLHIE